MSSSEAFREPWKEALEGPVGPFWGICDATPPYGCKSLQSVGGFAQLPDLALDDQEIQSGPKPTTWALLAGTAAGVVGAVGLAWMVRAISRDRPR